MKKIHFISVSVGVVASLLSLNLSGVVAADIKDPEELETMNDEPEAGESKKKSRFSSLKRKLKKEADKSTVVQAGKKYATRTGEAVNAVGDVGKAGIDLGKSAIRTGKNKLISKKQEEEAISLDVQNKSSPSVKEAARNLAKKTKKAAKKVGKAGLAGVELTGEVETAPTRAAIRAGQSVAKRLRSSKKDKEKSTNVLAVENTKEPIDQKYRERELNRLVKEKEIQHELEEVEERKRQEEMPVSESRPEKKGRERQIFIAKDRKEKEIQRKLEEEEQRKLEEELASLNEQFENERRELEEEMREATSQPEKQHELEKEELDEGKEYEKYLKMKEKYDKLYPQNPKLEEEEPQRHLEEGKLTPEDREKLIKEFQYSHPEMTREEIEKLLDD